MTHFRGGEWDEGLFRQGPVSRLGSSKLLVLLHANAHQEGVGQQDQGDVAILADEAADLILIHAEIFAHLQVLFEVPAGANGLHDGGQGGQEWGIDQVIG